MKHSFDYVKNFFDTQGCELLETAYYGAKQKLKFKCICGSICHVQFQHFKNGHRCKNCKKKNLSEKFKFKYEYVKEFFEINNCVLMEDTYKNNSTKMKFKCSCENIAYISFGNFRQGKRCRKCSGFEKYTYEYVKDFFETNNCHLLETEYINCHTKMKYVCKCGKNAEISFANFKNGKRCKECKKDSLRGQNNYQWHVDRESYEEHLRFSRKCYSILSKTLKACETNKSNKTSILLGYTPCELKSHITNHPNWEVVKNEKWHIDHIFPIKAFIDYNIKDIKLINCLDNLQPLKREENIKKNDSYDRCSFEKWIVEIIDTCNKWRIVDGKHYTDEKGSRLIISRDYDTEQEAKLHLRNFCAGKNPAYFVMS